MTDAADSMLDWLNSQPQPRPTKGVSVGAPESVAPPPQKGESAPAPAGVLPVGKAGRLAVDLTAQAGRLPDLIAQITGTGVYHRDEIGIKAIVLVVDRNLDRIEANVTAPGKKLGSREVFRPAPGSAATFETKALREWLANLLKGFRDTPTTKHAPLLVLLESTVIEPNVTPEACVRTHPKITNWLIKLAHEQRATIAILDHTPHQGEPTLIPFGSVTLPEWAS